MKSGTSGSVSSITPAARRSIHATSTSTATGRRRRARPAAGSARTASRGVDAGDRRGRDLPALPSSVERSRTGSGSLASTRSSRSCEMTLVAARRPGDLERPCRARARDDDRDEERERRRDLVERCAPERVRPPARAAPPARARAALRDPERRVDDEQRRTARARRTRRGSRSACVRRRGPTRARGASRSSRNWGRRTRAETVERRRLRGALLLGDGLDELLRLLVHLRAALRAGHRRACQLALRSSRSRVRAEGLGHPQELVEELVDREERVVDEGPPRRSGVGRS